MDLVKRHIGNEVARNPKIVGEFSARGVDLPCCSFDTDIGEGRNFNSFFIEEIPQTDCVLRNGYRCLLWVRFFGVDSTIRRI